MWEFLLLVAIYIFCFIIFLLILYIYVSWIRTKTKDQATNTADIPEEFQYREAEINENNKELLGIEDITSAFMMASRMGSKIRSNNTIVTVVDENEETVASEEEEEEEEESRPGSGIQESTLTEISNEEEEATE